VDVDVDVDADADGDADVHPEDVLFDPEGIRTYDLEVDPEDWQWLNDNAREERYVPANLELEGERFEGAGLRFKGGFGALQSCFNIWGTRTCAKLSMKVSFNEYDRAGRFHGLKKLQFHSMNRDPSQMRDRLAYGLYAQMGVVAPRTAYAMVRVNGEDQGLFVVVEVMDGRFTDRHFEAEGGDGNLYKEVWPTSLDAQPYLDALETNEEAGDVSGMIDFATALAGVNDETFLDTLGAWMDLDALYAFLAVEIGISHWDGIVAWYCNGGDCHNHNFYWYEEAQSGRMWLLPWDMDNSFALSPWEQIYSLPGWRTPAESCDPVAILFNVGVRPPTCDPLIERLGRLGADRYAAAAQEFLDGPFGEEAMLAQVDHLDAQIAEIVAADPFGPGADAYDGAVTDLRASIPTLRARIEQDIAP